VNARKLAQQITLVCDLASLLYFCTLPFTSAFFLSYPTQAIEQIVQLPDSIEQPSPEITNEHGHEGVHSTAQGNRLQ